MGVGPVLFRTVTKTAAEIAEVSIRIVDKMSSKSLTLRGFEVALILSSAEFGSICRREGSLGLGCLSIRQ